jgi:hypothetical protein
MILELVIRYEEIFMALTSQALTNMLMSVVVVVK